MILIGALAFTNTAIAVAQEPNADTAGQTTASQDGPTGPGISDGGGGTPGSGQKVSLETVLITAGATLFGVLLTVGVNTLNSKWQRDLTSQLQQNEQAHSEALQNLQLAHERQIKQLEMKHENENRYQTERQRVYADFLHRMDLMLENMDALRDEQDLETFVKDALKLLAQINILAGTRVQDAAYDLLEAIYYDTGKQWTLRETFTSATKQELGVPKRTHRMLSPEGE